MKYLFNFFFLSGFSFTTIHESQDCRGRGRVFFNSSVPLPPTSQTHRHWLGDYYRQLTSAHRQQSDSNREPLVSKHKSLTTKLQALNFKFCCTSIFYIVLARHLFSDLSYVYQIGTYTCHNCFDKKNVPSNFKFMKISFLLVATNTWCCTVYFL